MRSSSISAVAIGVALVGNPLVARADPYEEAVKQKVQDKLSNKEFHYHVDDVRRGFNHSGRETWIDGKSGQAKVLSITKEGDGLNTKYVAKIEVPVTSKYKRKTFIGIRAEHRDEGWETNWKYTVTYSIGFGSNLLTDGKVAGSSTAADHDAVKWAGDAFERDVVNKLKD